MKVIAIQELTIKNYRSFTAEDISFPVSNGLKLLSGENRVEPRLGSNGSGKSSLWDAVFWALYGTSVNGDKISTSLSWGKEQADVVLGLFVDNRAHVIHRYGPPVKVKLDNVLVEQPEVDKLIGLSKLRFLHSVIFGQDAQLFPDLSVPERGTLLDEVLDLGIWQRASDAAGAKHALIEKELLKKKSEIEFSKGQLETLPTNEQVNVDLFKWEDERTARITSIEDNAKEWTATTTNDIEELKHHEEEWKTNILEQIEAKAVEIENLEAELAPILFNTENAITNPFAMQISVLEHRLKLAKQERDIQVGLSSKYSHEYKSCINAEQFWANDKCPVCSQAITTNKKEHELLCAAKIKQDLEVKMNEVNKAKEKADTEITYCTEQLKELQTISIREQETLKNTKKEVERLQKQISLLEDSAKALIKQFDGDDNPFTKQITSLQTKENPYSKQRENALKEINPFIVKLAETKEKREKLTQELVAKESEYNLMESQMTATEYWKHGFKRIRLYFVNKVLAALQLEIQSALSGLGLENWKVTLVTESETKSQTIKLGVQIHIKSPQSEGVWSAWCGGEKQRLRLGIAMGLASLIQRAAGVWYNWEVYDEPTRALSPQGIEDLLEALRYRAEILKKQVWLTDHSNLQFSGFSEIWLIIKEQSGSKLEKLQGVEA